MISINTAFARIKRKKIETFAGDSYLQREDIFEKIPILEKFEEQQYLFGIYDSNENWTVLSVNYLYSSGNNELTILQLDKETEIVFDYFSSEGNDFIDDFCLKDGRRIWFKSSDLCQLVLNIMLMLKKVPCGKILDD